MPAYHGTWRVFSERPVPPAVLAEARKLVGGILDIGVASKYVTMDDGTTIRVLIQDDVVNVYVTGGPTPPAGTRPAPSDLWVPRGFVVYPAFHDAPGGYGLPVIPDAAFSAYDPQNLAPGLDLSRWTAGGPCGEVLISRDKDAGYPQNRAHVPVPLLYAPQKGPVFKWTGDTMYDNREADGTWKSYRIELDAPRAYYPDGDAFQSRALFEAINDYRDSHSQTKLNLNPRGYYHPAQVMVSIMQATGSTDETNTSYPATYRTSDDRLTKDGFSGGLAYGAFTSWNRGDNPTSYELRANGGGPSTVLAGWAANSTDNAWLLLNLGDAAFGDVGYRGGYWCADIIRRSRWIEAGNMNWQGSDPELPSLSWHGFAAMNLNWDTYPAVFSGLAAPDYLQLLTGFTTSAGDCWLNYARSTAPTQASAEPAMSRHIYMRGRSIAVAPRGGLVWGACVQAVNGADRLIALVHHPEDQPSDAVHEGCVRYLRVWWCDTPWREQLRADPQRTICGEDPADTWGWKGGQLIDLGVAPEPSYGTTLTIAPVMSLKMASQWKLHGDGTRAVCLRDYGSYVDYVNNAATTVMRQSIGLAPRPVELVFNCTADDVTTSVVWHDYAGAPLANPSPVARPFDTPDVVPWTAYQSGNSARAVDYTPDGSLRFAFVGSISDYNKEHYYYYVGFGPASAARVSDMQGRILTGAWPATPTQTHMPKHYVFADINASAFVAERLPSHSGPLGDNGDPCYPFTDVAVHNVRMYRGGQLVDEADYSIPDGVIIHGDLCTYAGTGVGGVTTQSAGFLPYPVTSSQNVQAFYVACTGEYVFSTQVSPVMARVLDVEPTSVAWCGCLTTYKQWFENAHWMTYNEWNPRGGRVISSVPLPEHDWFIYAKVV